MSAGRVVRGALFCALLLACGERAGDPVVALERERGEAGAAGAHEAPSVDEPEPGSANGPIGLCGPCTNSDDCGDANDACVHRNDEHFCGRDCDDQHGCPDGYLCVELQHTQLFQCVPETTCPVPALTPPPLADLRDYILTQINAERAARSQLPLDASSCLDELAQDSALDFARTDEPLGKYVKECDPIWPNCACGWTAEAELTIARYDLDWMTAVDHALASTHDSQTDRFVQSFLEYDVTQVGIGFWLSGDEAWLALSYR